MTSDNDITQELYKFLKEAAIEICASMGASDGKTYCPHFHREELRCDNVKGICFVQRWLDCLEKARKKERASEKKEGARGK